MSALAIAAELRGCSFLFGDERELQNGIAIALARASFEFDREVRLNTRDRIDFLTTEAVGVEVKVTSGWREVLRQLERYAESERVEELVLVTNRTLHVQHLPAVIGAKPLLAVLLKVAL